MYDNGDNRIFNLEIVVSTMRSWVLERVQLWSAVELFSGRYFCISVREFVYINTGYKTI